VAWPLWPLRRNGVPTRRLPSPPTLLGLQLRPFWSTAECSPDYNPASCTDCVLHCVSILWFRFLGRFVVQDSRTTLLAARTYRSLALPALTATHIRSPAGRPRRARGGVLVEGEGGMSVQRTTGRWICVVELSQSCRSASIAPPSESVSERVSEQFEADSAVVFSSLSCLKLEAYIRSGTSVQISERGAAGSSSSAPCALGQKRRGVPRVGGQSHGPLLLA